jgi:hypothetical protein
MLLWSCILVGEVVQYTEEQIRMVEESIRVRREAEPVELVQAVLFMDNSCKFDSIFWLITSLFFRPNPLKLRTPKVKKLRKVFAREEKRRKELPLVLKQKVSYDIVGRLRDLGDNSSVAEQLGSLHVWFQFSDWCRIM